MQPTIAEMTSAIAVVSDRASSADHPGPLRALRERLIGELLADADQATAVLAPDFELISWSRGTKSVTDRATMVESLRQLVPGSVFIWTDLDHLVADGSAIGLSGRLFMLTTAPRAGRDSLEADEAVLSSTPLAAFFRCSGELMTEETVHLDRTATVETVLHGIALPSTDELRKTIAHRLA
jgi:hypothetical protein